MCSTVAVALLLAPAVATAERVSTVVARDAATTVAAQTVASTLPPTMTATNTATASTSPSSSKHPSWWDLHAKWVAMVIVLAIGFVIITIVAILLKRHFERKRDKINGTFNAGITHRSVPMVTTAGPGQQPVPYNYDGADGTRSTLDMYARGGAAAAPPPDELESGRRGGKGKGRAEVNEVEDGQ